LNNKKCFGSSGGTPALQAQGPEFKHSLNSKKKKKKKSTFLLKCPLNKVMSEVWNAYGCDEKVRDR
jgi:hypothetical protein